MVKLEEFPLILKEDTGTAFGITFGVKEKFPVHNGKKKIITI